MRGLEGIVGVLAASGDQLHRLLDRDAGDAVVAIDPGISGEPARAVRPRTGSGRPPARSGAPARETGALRVGVSAPGAWAIQE